MSIKSKKFNSAFVYHFLLTKSNLFIGLASGNLIPGLSRNDILSLKLNIPTIPEQQHIASFLSSVDEKIQQLTRKKELLEHYKKGMMQQLFSGKLRFKDEKGKAYPDWEEKRLGEISSLLKDGSHGTHVDYPESEYYLLSAKNINNGKVQIDSFDRKISENDYNAIYRNYVLKKHDILLTIVGTIGRIAVYKNEKNIAFQRSVAFFRFEKDDPLFIYQLMNGHQFQNELDKRKVVSAQPGIYLGDLAKVSIDLPYKEEQQKIATFLSSIDTKIESITQQITQAQTFKKGLLQQLFV